jgi:uncharacterized protein YkwD
MFLGCMAYAADKTEVADPAIQLRDFYSFVSSMDSKKAEDRARLSKEIKVRSEKAPDDWLKRVGDKQKSLKSRVESILQGSSAQGLAAQLLAELDARRGEALGYIGGDAYTKETHSKVEEMVKKVEEIWKSPYDQFLARNESAKRALADVKELDGYLALFPNTANPPTLDEKKLSATFNTAVRDAWMPKNAVTVLQYNDQQAWLDEQERIHLKRLNEYRVMMGRMPLEADVRLTSAARSHSKDMKEKNFFSHESPLPGKKTFGDRAMLEGYRGASGENIYYGSTDGLSSFDAWYHSPGHHKNMIGGSKQIGAGRFEGHWTQVFGNDGPFAIRAGGKPANLAFYEKVLALPKDATVQARLDLAQFAFQNKLWDGAKQQLNEVLKAEPDHAMAKKVLAFVEGELAKTKKKS